MVKRSFILILSLVVILATAGCFDLFGVPGVAVSPDGGTVYFLSGGGLMGGDEAVSSLVSLSTGGGEPTVIAAGDKENLVSAYGINPVNGDVAYVVTGKSSGGTQIMIYSGGTSRELVAPGSFSSLGIGTMMRYSPDGSQIALTMTMLPAGITVDTLGSETDMSAEQLKGTQLVVVLINAADGSVKVISDPAKEAANTLDWSPDGKLLAYNAWVDGNGDGTIVTMPDFSAMASGAGAGPGDISQIRIYDVGSGSVTPITSSSIDYAGTFISNTEVAYVSLDFGSMMGSAMGGSSAAAPGPSVKAYDVASGASRVAYTGQGGNLVIGMALSPDGSQVAWVELPSSGGGAAAAMGGGSDSSNSPSHLYVGANFDASAGPLAEIPGDTGFPDAPVWTPDGKSLLVSSTNIFSSLIGQITAGFSGMSSSGSEATPTEEIPVQKLLKVDVASKEVTTLYQGAMTNSSLFASIIGLSSSGALDQMSSMGGS